MTLGEVEALKRGEVDFEFYIEYLSCEDFVPNLVDDNSACVLIGQGYLRQTLPSLSAAGLSPTAQHDRDYCAKKITAGILLLSTAPPYEKSSAYSSYLPLYSFYKPCLTHRSLLKLVIIFCCGSLATWCGNGYFCPSPRSSEGMPQSFTELCYCFKSLKFPQRIQVSAKAFPKI